MSTAAEEKLDKLWRAMSNTFLHTLTKAENPSMDAAATKEIEDLVVSVIKSRLEWGKCIASIENVLDAQAEEREANQQYVESESCLGPSESE